MLRPKRMSRVILAASKEQLPQIVKELYRHNLFHIREFTEQKDESYEGFTIGSPLEGASEAAQALVTVRSIESAIRVPESEEIPVQRLSHISKIRDRLEEELPEIRRKIENLSEENSRLEAKIKDYEIRISAVASFKGFPYPLEILRGYKSLVVLAGYVTHVMPLPVPSESYISGVKEGLIISVVRAEDQGEAERALEGCGFRPIPLPEESGRVDELLHSYEKKIAEAREEREKREQDLAEMRETQTAFLAASEEYLKSEVEMREAPLRFATTGQSFVAEGWVPSDRVEEIRVALETVTSGKIVWEVLPLDHTVDEVPVEYDNPTFAQPTQSFIDMYSRPSYSEIDPTLLLSLIFPFFFGLILGDVAYGLILLGICYIFGKYFSGEEGKKLKKVLRNASLSSIAFGLIFSEFLGLALPWEPLIISRHLHIGEMLAHSPKESIQTLIVITLWIGIFHLTLGRILGIINHAREEEHGDHKWKVMQVKIGWLLVMWGMIILIWTKYSIPYMPHLSSHHTLGYLAGGLLFILGVYGITRESLSEFAEIPLVISNIVSYSRLMAVGLSSVAIAESTNHLSRMCLGHMGLSISGILFCVMGILIFVGGHTFNTALGLLSGGLHSIRLNYVEFFTKFYKGGGIKYNPFGIKRRFTEE